MSNPLKKTMVFLGLAEEDLDQEERRSSADEAPKAEAARPAQPQRQAPVTPLRRVPAKSTAPAQPMSEILTVHPSEYRDAKVIAESFREGVPVIINLSRMTDQDAKRLIDFASGLTIGLNGNIKRVTAKVFLLSPEHIEIGSDAEGNQDSGSFFVSSSA